MVSIMPASFRFWHKANIAVVADSSSPQEERTMSTDKVDPKISSADYLTKTTDKGDVGLTAEELESVSGGTAVSKKPEPTGPIPIPYPNVA
jgi:hypothetical protein